MARLFSVLITVAVLALAAPQVKAETVSCAFKLREHQVYIDEMPKEVLGAIVCDTSELPINVLYVVRADKNRDDFMKWFDAYEDQMVPGRDKRRISKKSSDKDTQRFFEIETKRGPGKIMHLVFEALPENSSDLRLIYTDTEMRMKRFQVSLFPLAKTLMSPDYLKGIEEALATPPKEK